MFARLARPKAVRWVLLLMTWLLAGCLPLMAAEPLRIAYSTFDPYHFPAPDGRMRGFFYEIITEAVEKRLGVPVVWNQYPWPRCQENVRIGHDDALLTVPTPERLAYARTHAGAFYTKDLELFTYAGHPRMAEILGISTLEDIRAGGFSMITYSGNGWHREHVEPLDIRTEFTPYLQSVWSMLARRRGDLVIEWPRSAWPGIIAVNAQHKVVDTGIIVAAMQFHLLIRKGSPHEGLLDRFDAVIRDMRGDGSMEAILSDYF